MLCVKLGVWKMKELERKEMVHGHLTEQRSWNSTLEATEGIYMVVISSMCFRRPCGRQAEVGEL